MSKYITDGSTRWEVLRIKEFMSDNLKALDEAKNAVQKTPVLVDALSAQLDSEEKNTEVKKEVKKKGGNEKGTQTNKNVKDFNPFSNVSY